MQCGVLSVQTLTRFHFLQKKKKSGKKSGKKGKKKKKEKDLTSDRLVQL